MGHMVIGEKLQTNISLTNTITRMPSAYKPVLLPVLFTVGAGAITPSLSELLHAIMMGSRNGARGVVWVAVRGRGARV